MFFAIGKYFLKKKKFCRIASLYLRFMLRFPVSHLINLGIDVLIIFLHISLYDCRAEEIAKFITVQDKEMEEFVAARDRLIKLHGEKMDAMRRRHWEEEVELEKGFDAELTQLMEKYSTHITEVAADSV